MIPGKNDCLEGKRFVLAVFPHCLAHGKRHGQLVCWLVAHFLPFFGFLTGFGSGSYDFLPLSATGSPSIRLRRLIAFVT